MPIAPYKKFSPRHKIVFVFLLFIHLLSSMHKDTDKKLVVGPVNIVLHQVNNKSDIPFGIEIVSSELSKMTFVVNPNVIHTVDQTYSTLDVSSNGENKDPSFILYKRIPAWCTPIKKDSTDPSYSRISLSYGIKAVNADYKPVVLTQKFQVLPYNKISSSPDSYYLSKNGGTLSVGIEIKSINSVEYIINYFEKNKLKHQQKTDQIYANKKDPSYLHRLPVEIKDELKKYLVARYLVKKTIEYSYKPNTSDNARCCIS